ncbi:MULTISPECIES: hypothetical protein [unclassified Haladaptatus]|uniref:hypothetical protein n=1 Tax=unclassified Haladaptatus TaxID=2622732 RepID=UPI0023E84D29|nr:MULTISPECIES: hypothetical protein [unclassified Haladaptatus]
MVNYETIFLGVEPPEAAERISNIVKHLRQSQSGKEYEYRTNAGIHLATLSPVRDRSGKRKSKLRYRTSIIGAHLFHAHNKGKEIRAAVESVRVR